MTTYNAPEGRYEKEPLGEKAKVIAIPYGLTFLYLALGLGIVAAVGFGYPMILEAAGADLYTGSMIGMVIGYIGLLVFSVIIGWKAFSKRSLLVDICFFLDAVCWGFALSSTIVVAASYTDPTEAARIVGVAFGITAGVMALMGLFGILFKNAWKVYYMIPFLLLGILALTMINLFIFNEVIYWITEFVFFGVIMLETMADINQLKRLGQGGFINGTNNLAIYCAYTLMSDFVMLLIRLIPILLMSDRK